ncbi:MAG: 30S ribosome-binding factor RbfA [Elusimicrobiota bacterium]|jgi:ribosome-binding factor A|nr:30S ribosome-binding factor RbfA [Elusimicrobiota bacterium]
MIERTKRLEALFLSELSTIISRMIASGSFSGFITITGVRVSKDLATAKVFYSVFGGKEDKKNAALRLAALRGEIGSLLRKRLHIKRIPSFSFQPDDTPERASQLEKIFSKIEKDNEQNRV